MKKLISILFAFCIFTGIAYSQLNIIDNSREKLWYIVSGSICSPLETCNPETSVIKFGNEVIINGLTYTTVLKSTDSVLTSFKTISYIRESDRKVYYRPLSRDSDYILYDFNLGLSSKIYLTNTLYIRDYTLEYTVYRIDSIIIGSEKRKRMFLSGYHNEIWIEGIGSLDGLVFSGMGMDGSFHDLSCFSENGNVIYKNPEYENCFCTTDLEAIKEIDGNIYSSNGIVRIKGMTKGIFQLFDLSGLQILNREIENNNVNIDISMLKSGVYLYNIKLQNSNKGGKLIIKD